MWDNWNCLRHWITVAAHVVVWAEVRTADWSQFTWWIITRVDSSYVREPFLISGLLVALKVFDILWHFKLLLAGVTASSHAVLISHIFIHLNNFSVSWLTEFHLISIIIIVGLLTTMILLSSYFIGWHGNLWDGKERELPSYSILLYKYDTNLDLKGFLIILFLILPLWMAKFSAL